MYKKLPNLDLPSLTAYDKGSYKVVLQTSNKEVAEEKQKEYKQHGWKTYFRKVGDVYYVIIKEEFLKE